MTASSAQAAGAGRRKSSGCSRMSHTTPCAKRLKFSLMNSAAILLSARPRSNLASGVVRVPFPTSAATTASARGAHPHSPASEASSIRPSAVLSTSSRRSCAYFSCRLCKHRQLAARPQTDSDGRSRCRAASSALLDAAAIVD